MKQTKKYDAHVPHGVETSHVESHGDARGRGGARYSPPASHPQCTNTNKIYICYILASVFFPVADCCKKIIKVVVDFVAIYI